MPIQILSISTMFRSMNKHKTLQANRIALISLIFEIIALIIAKSLSIFRVRTASWMDGCRRTKRWTMSYKHMFRRISPANWARAAVTWHSNSNSNTMIMTTISHFPQFQATRHFHRISRNEYTEIIQKWKNDAINYMNLKT